MLRNGIPQDVVHALRAVSASFRGWGAAAHVTRPLSDGELLEFAGRDWRVLHRPGHSPSDTVFWDEASGELFGGDHLIKHISSNPLLSKPLAPIEQPSTSDGAKAGEDDEADGAKAGEAHNADRARAAEDATTQGRPDDRAAARPRALIAYLDSLRLTREMELSVVLAGHGDPVESHRELIDGRFRMHERRADKLCGLIRERPRNAYELAQEMWGNVAVTQAFLTLSEVLGHVDLLIEDGRVAEREADGVVHFQAT
jgi:glyoxylase-like metal-dependent hydrolase (beta-lactamase superfamily II)